MSTWQFDPIRKEDLPDLAVLYVQAFARAPWHERWSYASAVTRLTYFYDSPGFAGWRAVCGGKTGGFILGHRLPYEEGWIFEIKELCVSPELEGQHIGVGLFKHMEENIRLPLMLYTHPHLVKYYERLGCALEKLCIMSKKIG